MKKIKLIGCLIFLPIILSACSNTSSNSTVKETTKETTSAVSEETTTGPVSASLLTVQGNPLAINLSDIVEEGTEDYKAWIKISTLYDPEDSMYNSDSIPFNCSGIVVTFKISDMDCEPVELYWCYQLTSNGETVAVWDDTSKSDKLLVSEDGTYTMVLDTQKAFQGTIETMESLQIVFPGLTETTTTKFEVLDAVSIIDSSDLSYYTTGKTE